MQICVICVKKKNNKKNLSISGPDSETQNKWLSESCCDGHRRFFGKPWVLLDCFLWKSTSK